VDEEDYLLIRRVVTERNLKEDAFYSFKNPLSKYIEYHENKHNMKYYINKALTEQENGVLPRKSWLYHDLKQFRVFLNNDINLAPSTAKKYFTQIKSLYSHYDVQIPPLKPFKTRQTMQISYEDLPTREEIRHALTLANTEMQALILFQSSSGTTLHESTTLTVKMFLKAMGVQCDEINIFLELNKLKKEEGIVPLFFLERVKTNKFYYTCCSPEAAQAIINWLLKRHDLSEETILFDTRLFPRTKSAYTNMYHKLNKALGGHMVGKYGRFRSHALRKFHASNLGCGADLIDELQGRGKSQVHEAYIKDKPEKIREQYIKYMPNILINMDWNTDASEGVSDDVNTDGNRHDTIHADSTGDGPGDMQTTPRALMKELLERVAVLEYRVKQLEKKGV